MLIKHIKSREVNYRKILQGEHTKRGWGGAQMIFKIEMHEEMNFGKDYLPKDQRSPNCQ